MNVRKVRSGKGSIGSFYVSPRRSPQPFGSGSGKGSGSKKKSSFEEIHLHRVGCI